MSQKYKILSNLKKQSCVILPHALGLKDRKKGYLRFGHHAFEVDLITSKDLAANEIMISDNVLDKLRVPISSRYEVRVEKTEIILGPYIGILVCKKQENLNDTVQNLSNYLYDYDDIGGTIIAFAQEGIDIEKDQITGYVYRPDLKSWEPGRFHYPACIFRRSGMNQDNRNKLHSVLGEKIFNNYIFNKWEMHEWLSEFPEVNAHLPETIEYKHASDVLWFLDQFQEAYVKPIYGSQGLGIMKARKDRSGISFKLKIEDYDKELIFTTEKEAKAFLKEHFSDKRLLIQQGIDVLRKDNVMIDFRVLLVKNYSGKWVDMGMIARHGAGDSIVSNISSGGHASMAEDVFREVLGLSEEEILDLRNQVTEVATNAAIRLEDCGIHCGNLGVDIAIDNKKKIWIIEINNKDPNHTIAIDADDRQMFYETKKMNMLYAKNLAGF